MRETPRQQLARERRRRKTWTGDRWGAPVRSPRHAESAEHVLSLSTATGRGESGSVVNARRAGRQTERTRCSGAQRRRRPPSWRSWRPSARSQGKHDVSPPAAATRPAHARFSLHPSMAWSGAADPSASRLNRPVGPAAAHLVLNEESARSEVRDMATGERSTKRYLLPRFCYSQTSHAPKARGGRPRNGAPCCPPAPGS